MPPAQNGAPAVKSVGYIGLGNAGFSMASNLPRAGYQLVVHDADAAKAEKAAKEWKNTTASNGDPQAFANCEVIVTMLPQGKVVREVLLGKNGIASGLKAGNVFVSTQYIGVVLMRKLRYHHHRHFFIFSVRHNSTWQRACRA